MSPEQYRETVGGSVDFPTSFGTGRCVFAAGTLAGALLVCAPAQAQSAVEIQNRIEATFDLVLGNSIDLAVPLTRRALARRSLERDAPLPALPYSAVEDVPSELALPAEEAEAGPIEEGSAEDEAELARLPRPRPAAPLEKAEANADLIGQPLDLVAGAAATPEIA
ncbi:MAG: hypothetical protein ACRED5_18400, partial [Propylenella sp.]